MNFQTLKSEIRPQVENKIGSILKEEYRENIAVKLFKASVKIIRDSVDRLTECYYIPYSQQEKENFTKEIVVHIFEWKSKIQDRSNNESITGLDQLLCKKVIEILEEF
jgi:hypothetical protein